MSSQKRHPCRRTPPAWHDDGGNTRGGLLQAGQTHFTHTPTHDGKTPLFAPAPSSDHGMRKLRGSVIRAARTTGQTQQQQQRFSHSAPCQGSACSAHACEPGSLVAGDPAATCLWSEPAAAVVVERFCAAKRADGGQQQMLGCAPLACPALWANQSQTLQCRSPDAGSVGRASI